jgi:hypothetical protein
MAEPMTFSNTICENGLTKTPVFPTGDGGSTPTFSLQDLQVADCPVAEIREFIEHHHYSRAVSGVTPKYCFKVLVGERIVGAAIFGIPGMRETLAKYSEGGKYNLLELRRFCMVDETPRNSESRVLSIMLRTLRKHGVQRILSYADPNFGHVGTIYKALGFTLLGQSTAGKVVVYRERRVKRSSLDRCKRWSTRAINRFKNYENKDAGLTPFAQEVRNALKNGTATKRTEAGKFIYVKDL